MDRLMTRIGILACGLAVLSAAEARAQAPIFGPYQALPAGVICSCPQFAGPHYHVGGFQPMAGIGASNARRRGPAAGPGTYPGGGASPNEQGLPRGRRYYGGRYFGSFNNRYYGPQYGYF